MTTTTVRNSWNRNAAIAASTCLLVLSPLASRAAEESRLWTAAESGDLGTLTTLIQANTNLVHAPDRYGKLPLHYAAEAGHTEVVTFLLARGSDIMSRDNRGWTPLHHAAYNERTEVAALLVERGAEVDAANAMSWTPLHQAAFKKNKGLVAALVSAGANVYARTSRDMTPYNLAVASGRRDIVDFLVASMGGKDNASRQELLLASGSRHMASL